MSPTGVFEPAPSPGNRNVAAIDFRIDGYHLGVGSYEPSSGNPVPDYRDTIPHAGVAPLITDDTGRVGPYHAWRTFYPRYWLPVVNPGIDGGYRFGLTTTGNDVVGRHSIQATLQFPTNNTGIVGDFAYQYSGLGLPILSVNAFQDWQSLGGVFSRDPGRPIIGEVFRRTREAEVLGTWLRQRVRTAVSLTGGFGVEARSHSTNAPVPLAELDTAGELGSPSFPTLTAALGYANYQRPAFSISPEDGIQFNTTVRDRLRSGPAGQGGGSLSTVGILSLYKSLDLPGFAHHVIALRGAAGWADVNATGYYDVGGISGGTIQIVPGYSVGEGRSTFPVRGFPSGTLFGTRAFTGSAEYRAPLRMVGDAPEFCRSFSIARRSRSSPTSAPRGARTSPRARGLQYVRSAPHPAHRDRLGRCGAQRQPRRALVGFGVSIPFRCRRADLQPCIVRTERGAGVRRDGGVFLNGGWTVE